MLFAGESAQSEYILQRRQYMNQSSKASHSDSTKCQLVIFYIISLLFIPGMLLANLIVVAAEWYDYLISDISPCQKALRSLLGYTICYGVLGIWCLIYFIINLKCCRNRINETGSCGDYFNDIFTIIGVLSIYIFVVYNFAGTYFVTEDSFTSECSYYSTSVHAMLLADIIATHVVFDLLAIAFVPILIEKYQWS